MSRHSATKTVASTRCATLQILSDYRAGRCTPPARKQEIRDMQSGLMPREQVPM
jgi:hypothetical protein